MHQSSKPVPSDKSSKPDTGDKSNKSSKSDRSMALTTPTVKTSDL